MGVISLLNFIYSACFFSQEYLLRLKLIFNVEMKHGEKIRFFWGGKYQAVNSLSNNCLMYLYYNFIEQKSGRLNNIGNGLFTDAET